jgi:hypothetical protein
MCVDLDVLRNTPIRTAQSTSLLSHASQGRCPGCNADVVTKLCKCKKCGLCEADQQCEIAKPGDTRPTRKINGKTHLQAHFGVVYGRYPVFKIFMDQLVICILHLNLRIMGALFERTVLGEAGKHCDSPSTNPKVRVEDNCGQLFAFLKDDIGLPITKITAQKGSQVQTNWLSVNRYSFSGPDARDFIEKKGWVRALDLVMPKSARNGDAFLKKKHDDAIIAWECWCLELWPLINNKAIAADTKADQVQTKAVEFVTRFRDACGRTTCHLYPHLLVAHLPNQIRDLPCDITFFQTQGLEHRHKQRKTSHHNQRKPRTPVKHAVRAYMKKDGTVVRAHLQSNSISRQQQMLELSVAKDHIRAHNNKFCRQGEHEELIECNKRLKFDEAWQEEQELRKNSGTTQ